MRLWLVKKLLKDNEKGLLEEACKLAADTWADCARDPEMHKNEDDMMVASWAREASIRVEKWYEFFGG